MAKSKSLISMSSDDLFSETAPSTHPNILDYRRMDVEDVINQIVDARAELSILKKVSVNLEKIRKEAESKELVPLCNELHMLRECIKDTPLIVDKEPINEETRNIPTPIITPVAIPATSVDFPVPATAKRGRPKASKD